MGAAEHGPWRASTPADAARWLAPCPHVWWLAGGWALDAFLGRTTRLHGDLDVGCLRRDAPALLRALAGWEWFEAREGRLRRLAPGAAPAAGVHSLWGRPADTGAWHLELLLDAAEGDAWVFRRDPSIRRPLAEITWTDAGGMRILRPEIQLLYKAKSPRPQDDADLAAVAPHLDPDARAWLERGRR